MKKIFDRVAVGLFCFVAGLIVQPLTACAQTAGDNINIIAKTLEQHSLSLLDLTSTVGALLELAKLDHETLLKLNSRVAALENAKK